MDKDTWSMLMVILVVVIAGNIITGIGIQGIRNQMMIDEKVSIMHAQEIEKMNQTINDMQSKKVNFTQTTNSKLTVVTPEQAIDDPTLCDKGCLTIHKFLATHEFDIKEGICSITTNSIGYPSFNNCTERQIVDWNLKYNPDYQDLISNAEQIRPPYNETMHQFSEKFWRNQTYG